MSKYNESINTFTSGELSKRVLNRTDLDEYKQGLEEMTNFVPQRTGGAFRRMGTEHLFNIGTVAAAEAPAWDSEDVILIPYRSVIGDYFIALKIPNDDGIASFSFTTTDVNTGTNEITVTGNTFEDREMVYLSPDPATPGSVLPSPLIEGRPYYIQNIPATDEIQLGLINDSFSIPLVISITDVGVGDMIISQTNDYRLGDNFASGRQDSVPIRVFSRDYDASLHTAAPFTQGHEQEIIYPYFQYFNEFMPVFSAVNNLSAKGFKHVQYGGDLFITHSSGLFSPIALRIVGENSSGAAKFLLYSPLMADKNTLDENYNGVTSQHFISSADISSIVGFMPFQSQNTNTEVRYNIQTLQTNLPVDGAGLGILASDTSTTTILEARDAVAALIPGHFSEADIGSIIQVAEAGIYSASANMGMMYVTDIRTAVTYGDSVFGITLVGFPATLIGNANGSHRFSYSSFGPRAGYPQNVSFYQNRLHFGGTIEEPATVWASDVNDSLRLRYNVLDQDTAANNSGLAYEGPYDSSYAFRSIIASKSVSGITFMIDDDLQLRIGTPEGDFAIGFGRDGETGYSRGNKDLTPQSSFGSTSTQVFLANTRVVYLSHDASSIRAIDTKTRDFKYLNTNLSVLAEHMRYQPSSTLDSSSNINSSEFKLFHWQDGENILWAVNSRGGLVGLSLDNTLGIAGWHKHELGGDPEIISLCSAFGLGARYNDLVMVTRRNGKQQVEAIGEVFDGISLDSDDTDEKATEDKPRYLDAFIKINNKVLGIPTATQTITALHLANQTVSAIYDGTYEEGITLDGAGVGAITGAASTEIIVGLPYTSRITTLNLDRGQQYGTSRGNLSRVDRVIVSLYNSSYAKLKDGEDAESNSLELDETELFTGDKLHDLSQSSSREPKITIETDKPLPLNILGITTRGVSYDG